MIVIIGIPSAVGAFVYISRKLQILSDLKTDVAKVKNNLKVVSDYLTRHHNKFNPSELRALSPLQLTEEGRRMIEGLGFHDVFNENKNDFWEVIKEAKPELKYDVEVAAVKSIYALYDRPYMNFLKVFFYNNPERGFEDTAPTLGVFVRDEFLREHPEITQ